MDPNSLAIAGGPRAVPRGPPAWPPSDDAVRDSILAALADGTWGHYTGPRGGELAKQIASLHGTPHARLCSSGTIAVELALRGLGVKAQDEVALAGYDFGGNWRAIEAVGARPVLVDIVRQTWCLDVALLERALGERTKAVIVSHLHGGLAEMPKIREIAERRGLLVVEDACQCPGARVAGKPAGSWGDVGVWSFGGSKLLSTGRGGALFTSRPDVAQRIAIFCERGNDAFPLSELQAAALLPQLAKLAERNRRRAESVRRLLAALAGIRGLAPVSVAQGESEPGFYKLALLYSAEEFGGRSRAEFIAALQAEGVAIDAGFRGFAARPESVCRKPDPLPNSRFAAENTLVLHHPVLLEEPETIDLVAAAIHKVAAAFRDHQES